MELVIYSPQDENFVPSIKWNNEELKKEIAIKMEDYKGLQFTEDTIKEAKKDRAELNKLYKAIDDERKRIKKICMQPLQEFEAQVKEVLAIINEPLSLIDNQVKEVEERKKVEKKGEILIFFEENIGGLKGILPFEKVFKSEYLNATKSIKSIKEEILESVKKVNTDMDAIESLDSKYERQMIDAYIKTFDMSLAIREKDRLEAQEKALAERKAKEEAEKARKEQLKKEEESKLREAAQREQEATLNQETEREIIAEIEEVTPKLSTIDFRVTATIEQFTQLRNFLEANNISYGPIPNN